MYKGGIYDHFGGGFARYSTDREWLAPHFEKTLYDNAMLALCYTEAWQNSRMALYRQVAEATLDYCLRELRADSGGFYCGQDADSGGEEGAHYLFTPAEVKKLLGEDDGRHFCECYDITDEGNFHGKSIPNLLLNTRWNFVPEGYAEFRERLRDYRAERTPAGGGHQASGLMERPDAHGALPRSASFRQQPASCRRRKAGGVHALRLRPRRGYARLRIRRGDPLPRAA